MTPDATADVRPATPSDRPTIGARAPARSLSEALSVDPVGAAPEVALLGFARALRASGVPVTADREREFLRAVAEIGAAEPAGVFWAGRATLCSCPDDLARYARVFAAWFGLETATPRRPRPAAPILSRAALEPGDDSGGPPLDDDVLRARASDTDLLRQRDIADLSAAEGARLVRLFGRLEPRAPQRRAHRHRPTRRGLIDARRTLREQLRRAGEPGPIARRRRDRRPRRIVLLIDVSGSMAPYADALLRLAHRYVRELPHVAVFTIGTRLTHVTRALRHHDPDRALIACADAVPDWSGGTRLATNLDAFLRRWGRRGLARGAVVVVFSDGWERGDPADLAEQLRRLRAVAHRIVWVNPHRGRPGYEPIQGGIVAALPHLDEFVAGHSMAAFEHVMEVVAHA